VREALEAGHEVRARVESPAEYVQSFTSCNVIATLPGRSRKTIVVGGHHDCIEGSPGAVDNAAGVEAIFRVASRLAGRSLDHTVQFITWGGHEWGLFGSQYFVKNAKETGELQHMKACLTLDVLGCGDFLWIWAGPKPFRGLIESTLQGSDLARRREVRFEDVLVGSDDWSFSTEGVPGAMLMDWPMETLHLPEDDFDSIEEDKLDCGVEAALRIIDKLEADPGADFSDRGPA
jgi:Zn-dependent M28 family amino/carboxypeptidase